MVSRPRRRRRPSSLDDGGISGSTTLKASGYPPRKADAKIAHDIVLKAIENAGFHDKVTIKGGVVMSEITDAVRRATIDMDFDFLGYPLGDVSIRRFVQRLNRVAGCEIRIDGEIQELRQSEYRGKRVNLVTNADYWPYLQSHERILNASVEVNNYEPVTFAELVENNRIFKAAHPSASEERSPEITADLKKGEQGND